MVFQRGDVPALEACGLSKRYGRRGWALREMDVAVAVGGITALVGPNAAGKSTLIRTWLGFERPTRGYVRVAGLDPSKDRAAALGELGYVPQMAHLYEALTVEEHLDLAGQLRPSFAHAVARDRLGQLSIPLGVRGRELSGGQQAQVVLAIALATEASILLLDEPLAHLDPLARREFLRVVQAAVADGSRTALLSSHVVTDVEQVCDNLLLLGAGRVLLHESITDALAQHSVALDGKHDNPAIGHFSAADGSTVRLLGAPSDGSDGRRPPTLEELVLGYLAQGREAPQ